MSENNIEKLSACTNLDVVDKINELIDKVNIPDSIEIDAGELDRNLLKSTSNFHCKLTVITKRKSVLIFAVTNDGSTKEVKPIFVESNSTEDQAEFKAGSNKEFIYISTDNDIQIHYSQACIVIFDGLHGTYAERDTSAINKLVAVGSKPSEWLNKVPSTVTKTGDSNWLTVTATYDNNGKANEFRIGFNDAAVLGAIQDLNEQIQRDLAIIIESLRELTTEDTRINTRIDELSQALSALDLRVSTNTTNISNLSTTVNNLSTTVDSLSTTVEQHTTAIDALDGRLDDAEQDISDIKGKDSEQDGRLDDIEEELAGLDKSICKEVEIDPAKEYTRIGRFSIPTVTRTIDDAPVTTISDFSIELRVITDQDDEIDFISTLNTEVTGTLKDIKLIGFTNKSYTNISRDTVSNPNSGGELVIYEILPNDGYLDVYLKRYNSDRSTKVSVALINKTPNTSRYLDVSTVSKDYDDFDFTSTDTQILEADDEFKHNMYPIVEVDQSIQSVIDELVTDTNGIIIRKIRIPSTDSTEIICDGSVTKSNGVYTVTITKDGNPVTPKEIFDAISAGKKVSVHMGSNSINSVRGKLFTISAYVSSSSPTGSTYDIEFMYTAPEGGIYSITGYHSIPHQGGQITYNYAFSYRPERNYINSELSYSVLDPQESDCEWVVDGLLDGCFNEIQLSELVNVTNNCKVMIRNPDPNPNDAHHTNNYDIIFNYEHIDQQYRNNNLGFCIDGITTVIYHEYEAITSTGTSRYGIFAASEYVGAKQIKPDSAYWREQSDRDRNTVPTAVVKGADGTDVYLGIRKIEDIQVPVSPDSDTMVDALEDLPITERVNDVTGMAIVKGYDPDTVPWGRIGGPEILSYVSTSTKDTEVHPSISVRFDASKNIMVSVRGNSAEVKYY